MKCQFKTRYTVYKEDKSELRRKDPQAITEIIVCYQSIIFFINSIKKGAVSNSGTAPSTYE